MFTKIWTESRMQLLVSVGNLLACKFPCIRKAAPVPPAQIVGGMGAAVVRCAGYQMVTRSAGARYMPSPSLMPKAS